MHLPTDMEHNNTHNNCNPNVADGIKNVISELMNRVLENVLIRNPFIAEKHHAEKPLYAALVPDEIFKGSYFERRFVTPFGGAWEQLASVVAKAHFGTCVLGKNIQGTILSERLRRIQEVLNSEDHATAKSIRRKANWNNDLEYVMTGGGEPIPATVVCDLWVEDVTTGKAYSFELKGPMPNSDQTKVSKEKMLKLMAMNERPVEKAFYALVYNPYGKRENYAWPFLKRWFDIDADNSLLIGNELWDFLGGEGTYKHFIDEINALGTHYKEIIYRDYLNIEPTPAQLNSNLE